MGGYSRRGRRAMGRSQEQQTPRPRRPPAEGSDSDRGDGAPVRRGPRMRGEYAMTQPGWCTTTKAADVIRDLLARIQALEREVEDWRATYRPKSALVKELEAAEARVQALEAERDHERHEKETVADSS